MHDKTRQRALAASMRKVLEKQGYSITTMAAQLGITRARFQTYTSGRTRIPVALLRQFCQILSITEESLTEMSPDAPLVINENSNRFIELPYFGVVPAGNWEKPVNDTGEVIPVPYRKGLDRCFIVRIHGHSLSPYFRSGEQVVIKPSDDKREGVALVRNEAGEVTMKYTKWQNGQWSLKSINPNDKGPDPVPQWSIVGYAIGRVDWPVEGLMPPAELQ